MDKVKISKWGSREYSTRRVDYFLIKKDSTLHENICGIVSDLKIEDIDFDTDYSEFWDIIVSGNNSDKVVMASADEEHVWMMIDTEIEKHKIIEKIEKYFIL